MLCFGNIWKPCLSWKLTLRFLCPRVSYIVLCTLSIFNFFFSFLFLFILVCWSNGLHTTLLSSCCVWPKSRGLGHRQAPSLWKHLCCWWVRKKKDKRTCDPQSSDTGNWVTTSRKEEARGCRKHLGAIPAYLFSEQQRANHSSGSKWPGWTGRCQECFWPQRKFIHAFTHSFIHL